MVFSQPVKHRALSKWIDKGNASGKNCKVKGRNERIHGRKNQRLKDNNSSHSKYLRLSMPQTQREEKFCDNHKNRNCLPKYWIRVNLIDEMKNPILHAISKNQRLKRMSWYELGREKLLQAGKKVASKHRQLDQATRGWATFTPKNQCNADPNRKEKTVRKSEIGVKAGNVRYTARH